jgi:hypothetical protein
MTQLKNNNTKQFNKNVNNGEKIFKYHTTPNQTHESYNLYKNKTKKPDTKKNLINNKNNNINRKSKNHKTLSNNIDIITQYTKKLEQKGIETTTKDKDYKELKQIYDFLKSNINKLTTAKDNYIRKTKKTSFLNKFKSSTSTQLDAKQSYYRLLLENNFITEIIKINDDNIIKDCINTFIKFLEKENNNYSFTDFTKKINSIRTSIKNRLEYLNHTQVNPSGLY